MRFKAAATICCDPRRNRLIQSSNGTSLAINSCNNHVLAKITNPHSASGVIGPAVQLNIIEAIPEVIALRLMFALGDSGHLGVHCIVRSVIEMQNQPGVFVILPEHQVSLELPGDLDPTTVIKLCSIDGMGTLHLKSCTAG